ncbi:MAG: type II toxin-antitoxin system VapC family toxin [Candidatus Humimicrobiaceae bacterium]
MKILFDTSILVAAFIKTHPKHVECFSWFKKTDTGEIKAYVSVHTLLEFYSAVTGILKIDKLNPDSVAELMKRNIYPHLNLITYTETDYKNVLINCAELHITGGTCYDFLIAYAAFKQKVDFLLTLNKRDFEKFSSKLNLSILEP